MLHRTRHHPQRRDGNPNPTLFRPIARKPQFSSSDKENMNRTVTLSTPRNQIKHTKDTWFLIRVKSKISSHHTEPGPDNVESRINTYRPIKKIKNGRGIGKRHLRGPNRTNNSSPRSTFRRGGDIGSLGSMKTSRKILTTNLAQFNLKTQKLSTN